MVAGDCVELTTTERIKMVGAARSRREPKQQAILPAARFAAPSFVFAGADTSKRDEFLTLTRASAEAGLVRSA
jgi:hypothetical protein